MIETQTLSSCELFAGLSDEELAQIATIASQETYEPGELIFAECEMAERLYILQTGCVELRVRLRSALEPGGEVTIEEMEPGRICGWSSLVKQRRFTASARALEPATVLAIEGEDLSALFDRNAHIGFVVMKQLAEVIASRLRHTRALCQEYQDDCGQGAEDQ